MAAGGSPNDDRTERPVLITRFAINTQNVAHRFAHVAQQRMPGRDIAIVAVGPQLKSDKRAIEKVSRKKNGLVTNVDWTCTGFAPVNRKWAGDISYIWKPEDWLYLAVILDPNSRHVVGWAVSDRMKKDLAIRALDMAVRLRQPPEGCLFHWDRGSQYCYLAL